MVSVLNTPVEPYCSACGGPCYLQPEYKLKLADGEVEEPYVPGSLTMSPEQMAAMADRVSEQFIKDSPKAAAYLGFVKPKMEPRKGSNELIEKNDFKDGVDTLFDMLDSRQRNLRDAKYVLGPREEPLFDANNYNDYSRAGCRLKLTQAELLVGNERALNEAENAIQKCARELRDTLDSLVSDLNYRPPIVAEA